MRVRNDALARAIAWDCYDARPVIPIALCAG